MLDLHSYTYSYLWLNPKFIHFVLFISALRYSLRQPVHCYLFSRYNSKIAYSELYYFRKKALFLKKWKIRGRNPLAHREAFFRSFINIRTLPFFGSSNLLYLFRLSVLRVYNHGLNCLPLSERTVDVM